MSTFFITEIEEDGDLILGQDFENTIINRRFDESTTQWEFDYYDLIISDDISTEIMDIDFPVLTVPNTP